MSHYDLTIYLPHAVSWLAFAAGQVTARYRFRRTPATSTPSVEAYVWRYLPPVPAPDETLHPRGLLIPSQAAENAEAQRKQQKKEEGIKKASNQ